MNGPEHYREAERLILMASKASEDARDIQWFDGTQAYTAVTLAAAQVHATLALAAATVLEAVAVSDYLGGSADVDAWSKATAPTAVTR